MLRASDQLPLLWLLVADIVLSAESRKEGLRVALGLDEKLQRTVEVTDTLGDGETLGLTEGLALAVNVRSSDLLSELVHCREWEVALRERSSVGEAVTVRERPAAAETTNDRAIMTATAQKAISILKKERHDVYCMMQSRITEFERKKGG